MLYILLNSLQINWNRLLLILMMGLGCGQEVIGQYRGPSFLMHMRGVSEVELDAGLSDLGLVGAGYYLWHLNHQWFIRFGGTYEMDLDARFNNRTLSLDGIVGRYVVHRRIFYLRALLGPTVVFEHVSGVDWDREFLHPLPGGAVGAGMEIHLTQRLAITTTGLMRMVPTSELGRVRFYLLSGINYSLKN